LHWLHKGPDGENGQIGEGVRRSSTCQEFCQNLAKSFNADLAWLCPVQSLRWSCWKTNCEMDSGAKLVPGKDARVTKHIKRSPGICPSTKAPKSKEKPKVHKSTAVGMKCR
ncbi:hypothetical protein ABKV19_002748, partial [Rosa sericea]